MRITFSGLLTAICVFCAGQCAAQDSSGAIVLADHISAFTLANPQTHWLEPARMATVEQAVAVGSFTNLAANTELALNRHNTAWIKLRLRQPAGSAQAWSLNIPLAFVDSVVLYQPDSAGRWQAQTAGNHVPRDIWSHNSLYPEFELRPNNDKEHSVYLQIRNFNGVHLPIRFEPTQQRNTQRLGEFALLGLVVGSLICMALLSAIRFAEHHNRADFLACLYGIFVTLLVAVFSGLAQTLLGSSALYWSSAAYTALAPLTMGMGLFFLRALYAVSTSHKRYDFVVMFTAWFAIVSTLALVFLERETAHLIVVVATYFAAAVGMVAAQLSWRFRSTIGKLVFAAFMLQFLAVLRLISESWGLASVWWSFHYIASVGVAISVPLLLYALTRATHGRKTLAQRAYNLPNQDALTGLLTRQAFMEQYARAYERVISDGEPVAVVLISVINHEHIREAFDDTTAEQCLLRAVIKLQRMLRDVDPAGRVDTNRFALLLEGVADKDALNQRMVQLIASGLTPIPGLTPEVNLQFQAACVLLHHYPVSPERIMDELGAVLHDMSPRTRRPIRFLEAPPTSPIPSSLSPDSTMDASRIHIS
jgi:two-component system, sensor histidine kinase LadS